MHDQRTNRPSHRHAIDAYAGDEPRWLWPRFIPYGRVTVMWGERSAGKSLVAIDVVARLTTGRSMPDGSPCAVGSAVVVCADGVIETVVPRLEQAGADLSRVVLLESTPTRQIVLPRDVILLSQHINAVHANLVVIDPLLASLDPTLGPLTPDEHPFTRDELELATAPLDLLAVASDVALLVVLRDDEVWPARPRPNAKLNATVWH